MAGGYTGQLVSLDTNTPTEVEANQAQADQAANQSQLSRATMPAEIAIRNETAKGVGLENEQRSIANQSANLTLQQQMQLTALKNHYLQQQAAGAYQPSSPEMGQAQDGSPLPGGKDTAPTSPLAAEAPAPLPSLFDPRVQQVMQSIDPNDPQAALKFDTQMSALAEDVPQAGQFVGQYSGANIRNWRSAIGAHGMANLPASQLANAGTAAASPLAAATDSGGLGAPATPLAHQPSPIGPAGDRDLAAMSVLDPKGTGEMLAMQGMIKYQQTGNPAVLRRYAPDLYAKLAEADKSTTAAQKEAIATRFDTMGRQANAVLALAHRMGNDAPEVRAAYNSAVTYAGQQGWLPPATVQKELTQPIDFANLANVAATGQTVSEYMTSSGTTAANEARAKAANPDVQSQYIGTDTSGRPIYHNTHAPAGTPDTVGNLQVNAKPSAGAATFEAKQAAYLKVHPDDTQGAIEFANGQRTLPPGEAAVAARAAADREQQTAALSGQPFDVNAAYQAHLAEFQGQGAAPAPGSPAAGPTAQTPTGGNPNAGRGWTHQQSVAAQTFRGAKGPAGTSGNPAVPTNAAQYKALPKGAVYIQIDGSIRTKT